MAGNLIGKSLQLLTWGESHGYSIGGVIDGVPANLALDFDLIQDTLNKRKPGQNSLTTQRNEDDRVEFLSGIFKGKTLGTPIAFMVKNKDQRSKDYDEFEHIYRPGHGDYTYQKKYGIKDHKGGGRASARTTIAITVAGAIALQILQKKYINATIKAAITSLGCKQINYNNWCWDSALSNIFTCPDKFCVDDWQNYLTNLALQGKSCGAQMDLHINGLPVGLGEPVFDKLDADLAHILMGINAVKGVEIGAGFGAVETEISYDEMYLDENNKENFKTNYCGGILAGISTGQTIVAKIAFKATSSNLQTRESINHKGEKVIIKIHGRHDPCVALRAIPIVESAAAFICADHALRFDNSN
jgi:chorismate synthase